jgi:hypothetical protein
VVYGTAVGALSAPKRLTDVRAKWTKPMFLRLHICAGMAAAAGVMCKMTGTECMAPFCGAKYKEWIQCLHAETRGTCELGVRTLLSDWKNR